MEQTRVIWLASYPRSGNTMLRTILWQCFGFRTSTIYAKEFQDNEELANYVGHIEAMPGGVIQFPKGNPALVKTHEHPKDENPAIYVVRDGRPVAVSLSKFYNNFPLEVIIEGKHLFGTWSDHLNAWRPWERPNTLLLKYEDMVSDLPSILKKISEFLKCNIINDTMPDRDTIAAVDGRIVRKKSDWRSVFPDELMKRFLQINGAMLEQMGYSR